MSIKLLDHADPSEEYRDMVKVKKQSLCAVYQLVDEEQLVSKITQAENCADRCNHKESWDLDNEITGRKKSNGGLIKGGLVEAQREKKKWLDHFKFLLGQHPEGAPDDLEIVQQHEDLNIDKSPFTKDGSEIAMSAIKEEKAFGEDEVPPEVIKCSDLDDIIFHFCNKALVDGLVVCT